MTLPTLLTIAATVLFLVLERVYPGRPLPHSMRDRDASPITSVRLSGACSGRRWRAAAEPAR